MFSDEIESKLKYLIEDRKIPKLSLTVHPYLEAYFTKGFLSSPKRAWYKKYKKKIPVIGDNSYQLLEYNFFDGKGELIKD